MNNFNFHSFFSDDTVGTQFKNVSNNTQDINKTYFNTIIYRGRMT